VLGEEHPHTAQSYNNLALNLEAQGRYKEAEEGYQHHLQALDAAVRGLESARVVLAKARLRMAR
jgi:hypothetical protein